MKQSFLSNVGLKAKYVKCFGPEPTGFDTINTVNIAIGRNNSGKSALIDLVQCVIAAFDPARNKNGDPEVRLEIPLDGQLIRRLPELVADVPRGNGSVRVNVRHWIQRNFSNPRVVCTTDGAKNLKPVGLSGYAPINDEEQSIISFIISAVSNPPVPNPFAGCQFFRVAADRDIRPEPESEGERLGSSGAGLTNLLRKYLHDSERNNELIEIQLRDALNEILRPDVEFNRLSVQSIRPSDSSKKEKLWEIFLHEERKGQRIALSQTGSGIKTVLLVLANVLLMPLIDKERSQNYRYVFALEELENNLHPAAQRRLFEFLSSLARQEGYILFVTTHSSAVIDQFASDPHAQLLHVTHDGDYAKVTTCDSPSVGRSILDDLDVRASDLLQTNAIVWVEGPSDRIYLNQWISVWSSERLKPGVHFQCLPYGGSCERHYCFDDPELERDLVETLRINRHAVFVTDSNKRSEDAVVREVVQRLRSEVESVGGIAMITIGREIENYIPPQAWKELIQDLAEDPPGQYDNAVEFALSKISPQPSKVQLARKVAGVLNRQMIASHLDLAAQLEIICNKIAAWNKITLFHQITPLTGAASAE